MKKTIITLLALTITSVSVVAQDIIRTKNNYEFELKAGLNFLGGTAPMGLPVEIRSIDGYKPKFGGSFEGVATRWFGEQHGDAEWGISAGLRIENRGMSTKATVKSFFTSVPVNNTDVSGYWTGKVDMDYASTLLSIPVLANYRFNRDWKVRAGLYVGYQLDGKFGGAVYDGYLRNGTPTGIKMPIEGNQQALYDFSEHMQRWQSGLQAGFSWRAYKHFHVNADLNWGFTNIFKKDFKAISFNMYPIYLQAGFGYQF